MSYTHITNCLQFLELSDYITDLLAASQVWLTEICFQQKKSAQKEVEELQSMSLATK